MNVDVLKLALSNPAVMAYVCQVAVEAIRGFCASFDKKGQVDQYRPYIEKGVVVLTVLLSLLKASLEHNLASAPWDVLVNAVLFFIGAKAAPSTQVKNGAQSLVGKVKNSLK